MLLSPQRISDAELHTASWLDGMERTGIGRHLSLAQLQEEDIKIDLCVLGGLAFNTGGVIVWEGHGLFEVQWALLHDIKVLKAQAPVIAVAHASQVVDEIEIGLKRIEPEESAEVQCDYVVTNEKLFEVQGAVKPASGIDFDTLDPKALDSIPPLQELRGIRMMEKIMKDGGFANDEAKDNTLTAEEQLGIDMMEKIMKGFKV